MNPLESSFLIHKAMRFDSKGGRIPDVISDNYEKLAPSADTRLRVNRSGICHGTHKTKLGYLERGGFICN